MTVLTELRNRGVADAFIVCCDGLKGLPDVDPGHLAAGRRAAVRRASRPLEPALHVEEALGAGVPGDARDLHRPHRRGRRGPLRRVRRHLARALSGDDRHLGAGLGRVRAVPRRSPSSCATSSTRPTPSRASTPGSARRSATAATSPTSRPRLKVLYLVATERRPNRSNPTGKINGWKKILNALTIHYGDRIAGRQLTMTITPAYTSESDSPG